MSTAHNATSEATEALRTDVAGGVFVPGDPGYDQARQTWNLSADERPAMVVEAESAADSYRRLEQIKTSCDPDGLMISAHPV